MKRKICLSLLGLGFALLLHAQDSETALAKIHYNFKHINDTTERGKSLQDEVVTYLGKAGSFYTSYSSTRMQEDVKRQTEAPDFNGEIVFNRTTTAIGESYFFNVPKHVFKVISSVGGDSFYAEEAYPTLDWTILDDTKTIGGYTCQKAQTTYKGRTYEAWFTTELPFSSGPWKLQGLPGLILAAHDLKNEVIFDYAGFDKLDTDNFFVAVPSGGVKSTPAEVKKLKEAFAANPSAYMKTRANSRIVSGTSGGSSVSFVSASSASSSSTASSSLSTVSYAVGGGSVNPNQIKSVSIKNSENYNPSKNTNNPIELN